MSTPTPPQPDPTIEAVRQSDRRAIQNARRALDAADQRRAQAVAQLQHALYVAAANDVLSPSEQTAYAGMSDESRRRWARRGAELAADTPPHLRKHAAYPPAPRDTPPTPPELTP